ncbi:MAG TPA: DUF1345 domain-containing protein [Candidatus Corynebacterium avicola]|uniref:DUF1345 domain-containing protein n=1 Tax=Candidatus Corynebacterium avicola TaxID=2838527 RepID=A0A9D1RP14_9CORY|nr:DUF1345 domain-containing protein [Candidatus Corynebacterium avicola]
MGNMEDDPDTPRTMRSDLFRNYVSALVAFLIAAVLVLVWIRGLTPPSSGSLPDRAVPLICFVLVFWPVFVAIYLLWTHRAYSSLDPDALRTAAESDREHNRGWLGWWSGLRWGAASLTTTAAIFAVVVTIAIALTPGMREDTAVIILTMLMVAASWAMMVYGFALDYMRMTATQDPEETPHLKFTTTDEPAFSDFLTLAVMVSTMGSGLPAEVRSGPMWRRIRTNAVMAFFFNSVIVAMMVSLVFGGITAS